MSTLKIKRENGKIFCPLADSWHIETPEEKVRQEYIKILVEDYGYSLDQMAQEIKVNNSQRGQGKACLLYTSGEWKRPPAPALPAKIPRNQGFPGA